MDCQFAVSPVLELNVLNLVTVLQLRGRMSLFLGKILKYLPKGDVLCVTYTVIVQKKYRIQ